MHCATIKIDVNSRQRNKIHISMFDYFADCCVSAGAAAVHSIYLFQLNQIQVRT